ncbi:phosphate system positive regulatory protein pho81, partial [Coemansia sp. RSA 1878]
MKFEQHLALITIPSWSKYYLNYKHLKQVLYANASVSGEEFQVQFEREITKVNQHYCEQEESAQAQLDSLQAQWHADMEAGDKEVWKAKFTQLLQQLEHLADYTQACVTGCRKILKKADK